MCTPRGATATAEGIWAIVDGHSENCEGQVRRFWGVYCLFLLAMHLVGRVKTPAVPTNGI